MDIVEVKIKIKATSKVTKSTMRDNISTLDKIIDTHNLSLSETTSIMATKYILIGIQEQLPSKEGF